MNTSSNSFGVAFFVKRGKEKDGMFPIYARISVNSKRVEISVKRWVAENNWHSGRGKAKGTKDEIVKLNNYLEKFRSKIVECYQELVIQRKTITPELIKNLVNGKDESSNTLVMLMDFHNIHQKNLLEWGTMKNYYTTQKYVKDFVKKQYRSTDIPLSDISYKFITEFEFFLRNL